MLKLPFKELLSELKPLLSEKAKDKHKMDVLLAGIIKCIDLNVKPYQKSLLLEIIYSLFNQDYEIYSEILGPIASHLFNEILMNEKYF